MHSLNPSSMYIKNHQRTSPFPPKPPRHSRVARRAQFNPMTHGADLPVIGTRLHNCLLSSLVVQAQKANAHHANGSSRKTTQKCPGLFAQREEARENPLGAHVRVCIGMRCCTSIALVTLLSLSSSLAYGVPWLAFSCLSCAARCWANDA